jgi:hypothetical protein
MVEHQRKLFCIRQIPAPFVAAALGGDLKFVTDPMKGIAAALPGRLFWRRWVWGACATHPAETNTC